MKAAFLGLVLLVLAGCSVELPPPDRQVHAFYYPWYGNPEHDDEYYHWRHETMGAGPLIVYPGGKNIGADYYPAAGCYSSNDPATLRRHMTELRQAGVGVICVSWLGPDSFEARVLPPLMDMAAEFDIMVNFHLEPAVQESIHAIRAAIVYLVDEYGDHPAFYRSADTGGRGLFYVYDSYQTEADQWARLLDPKGDLTIRDTPWDAAVLALLVDEGDLTLVEDGGFDGAYAYFAVDGFSFGSTSRNWPSLVRRAQENGKIFIPSVGPGYRDLRIRPWNGKNQRSRRDGLTYDCLFGKAIASGAAIISLTSFNEWHEGTQIEPAIPLTIPGFTYADYGPLDPDHYLERTAHWVQQWDLCRQGKIWSAPDAEENCGGVDTQGRMDHLAIGSEVLSSLSPHETYTAAGNEALVDGVLGSASYRDGYWLGFEGEDPVFTLDLGTATKVGDLALGYLVDHSVWIFAPVQLKIEGSSDGVDFEFLAQANQNPEAASALSRRRQWELDWPARTFRYFRITVQGAGVCPAGHPGAGQPAWVFVDELILGPAAPSQ